MGPPLGELSLDRAPGDRFAVGLVEDSQREDLGDGFTLQLGVGGSGHSEQVCTQVRVMAGNSLTHLRIMFGLSNMRTVLHCLPPKDWTDPGFMGLGMIYTAMPVINAVPAVVAAPPGIVTLKDLPPITGRAAV
jgi:hypothetical protein